MTNIKVPSVPVILGVGTAALLSLVFGLIYIAVLNEPGSAFYPFAGLICVIVPLIGGFTTLLRAHAHRLGAFLIAAAAAFAVSFALFFLAYAVLPQFSRANVRLPEYCDSFDGGYEPPSSLLYTLPDSRAGILITSDAQSALVAVIDPDHPPFPSTALLVDKIDNSIISAMPFANDVISAAIAEGILYIYNDKLGYLIDARTGSREQNFLLIDNYGGLTTTDRPFISRASDGHWYMETTAVISSWNVDGTVVSRPHLTLNGIARGCFIAGDTQEVFDLDP